MTPSPDATGPPGPARRRPVSVPVGFLVLAASLYAVQGVVVAYLFNFNKAYMKAQGLREDLIGFVQTLSLLPLAFKFLVGPLSDRFSPMGLGHRLPYIVGGLVLQAAGLVGLATIDPARRLSAFAAMAVTAVVGLAFYDTSCDGLVVDMTPPPERARVQGLLWTSRFVAATAFTLGFGVWISRLGGPKFADRLLFASAGLTLLPIALALALREPPRSADAERFAWSALGAMVKPWSLALLAFGGLYGIAGMGVESNVSLYYERLGLDPGGDVGAIGAARNGGRATGALLLPLALARFPRWAAMAAGVVGLAASVAGQAFVSGGAGAGLMGLAFGAAMGWNDTLFAALAMEAADPRLAASTFALFMAVTNLSVLGDALFSRMVVATGGYRLPFLASALAVLATLPLIRALGRPGPASPPAEAEASPS